jgi:ABC-type Zn uptake system ZnuABC Zn-binding protein ZnuA/ABC-type Mn2+/Zn2+ transport system permease subunit
MLEPFEYAFVQRGLIEILLLSVSAGLLGTWVVLRGLSFYAHAVGTAAFPGLVLADGLAFSPILGALGAAALFMVGVERLARSRRGEYDILTALALVGALAIGVILASDVFQSGSNIETLLFGSLLLLEPADLVIAGFASTAALVASMVLGRRWVAIGFDSESARALGVRSPGWDAVLLALVTLSVISALSAVGALLTTALFVVPAATVRLWTRRLRPWQLASVALTALEGTIGLWVSVQANVPPGPAIAVVGAAVFAMAFAGRWLRSRVGITRLVAAGSAGLLGLIAAGCGSVDQSASGSDFAVIATTTQIADWTREVGGAAVDVRQILQPNTDPHDYEPRPADVEATSKAKVVFESGEGIDAWMSEVVEQSEGNPVVVALGDRIPVRRVEEKGATASPRDPHWWHDPRNVEGAVGAIRDALTAADPARASVYARNARTYIGRLRALDAGIVACVATIPDSDRKLVTDHDAFGYFAARYGFRVVGAVIPSQSTQAQPSAGETAELVDLIEREGVKAVFSESSLNPELAKTISEESGASSEYTLYGDSLGPAGSSGATYLTMEQANADAITSGLTGGTSSCTISGS